MEEKEKEKPERRGLAPISFSFCRVSFPLPITAPLPSLHFSVAFSFHPKHLAAPFCPSSIFHLGFSLTPIPGVLPPSSPLPCEGDWNSQMNGGQKRSQRASVIHSLCPSPTPSLVRSPPPPPLSLRLAAARIVALRRALRWRACTVGSLQLS